MVPYAQYRIVTDNDTLPLTPAYAATEVIPAIDLSQSFSALSNAISLIPVKTGGADDTLAISFQLWMVPEQPIVSAGDTMIMVACSGWITDGQQFTFHNLRAGVYYVAVTLQNPTEPGVSFTIFESDSEKAGSFPTSDPAGGALDTDGLNAVLSSPLRASHSTAASATDDVVLAAQPGLRIRVLGVVASAEGTSTAITFNSKGSGAGTAISSKLTLAATGPTVIPYAKPGWFQTNAGEGLTVTTGSGATVDFQIIYQYVRIVTDDLTAAITDDSGTEIADDSSNPFITSL